MKNIEELPHNIAQGDIARLIPIGAEGNKEGRATSSLLATFMAVPEYARRMLGIAGCKVTTRSKIKCYTEIVFKENGRAIEKNGSDRPDGLIIVQNGKNTWSAIVEAKIGKATLDTKQVESYLDLAKKHKIDAVITISNQYANIPTHHPVKVNGNKTKGAINLHHWSWKSLLTEAVLHTNDNKDVKDIDDSTQHFILSEFKRFLQHPSTGVNSTTRMNKNWAEAASVTKTIETENAIGSWHNLCRELTLELSEKTGTNVSQVIARKYKAEKDGYANMLKDDVNLLCDNGCVEGTFAIKNAASNLYLTANLREKTIESKMTLQAPANAKTAKSSIGWLIKQLNDIELANVHVRARYKWGDKFMSASIEDLLKIGYEAINDDNKRFPVYFDVYTKQDVLAGDIKAVVKFSAITAKSLIDFYEHVGQNLKSYQSTAPKILPSTEEGESS